MIPNILRKLFRRRHGYPPKRDEFGQSARKRALQAFERGRSPEQVASETGISLKTARRYFYSSKKLPSGLEAQYSMLKYLLKHRPVFKQRFVETIAHKRGMSVPEVTVRLQRPWGLKELLMGKWPDYIDEKRQREAQANIDAALDFVRLMESCGMSPEELRLKVQESMKRALNKRRAEQTEQQSKPDHSEK